MPSRKMRDLFATTWLPEGSINERRAEQLQSRIGRLKAEQRVLMESIDELRKDRLTISQLCAKALAEAERYIGKVADLSASISQRRRKLITQHNNRDLEKSVKARSEKLLIRQLLKTKKMERRRAESNKLPHLTREPAMPPFKPPVRPVIQPVPLRANSKMLGQPLFKLKEQLARLKAVLQRTGSKDLEQLIDKLKQKDKEREAIEGQAMQLQNQIKYLRSIVNEQKGQLNELESALTHTTNHKKQAQASLIKTQLDATRSERLALEAEQASKQKTYREFLQAARLVIKRLKPEFRHSRNEFSSDGNEAQLVHDFSLIEQRYYEQQQDNPGQIYPRFSSRLLREQGGGQGDHEQGRQLQLSKYYQYEKEALVRNLEKPSSKFLTREELRGQMEEIIESRARKLSRRRLSK